MPSAVGVNRRMNFKSLKPAAKWMLMIFGFLWMGIFISVGIFGEATMDAVSIASALSYFFAWFWIIFTPIAFALGYFFVPTDSTNLDEAPHESKKRSLFHR